MLAIKRDWIGFKKMMNTEQAVNFIQMVHLIIITYDFAKCVLHAPTKPSFGPSKAKPSTIMQRRSDRKRL